MPESDDSRNSIAGESRERSFDGTDGDIRDWMIGSFRVALARYDYQASSAPEMIASVSIR